MRWQIQMTTGQRKSKRKNVVSPNNANSMFKLRTGSLNYMHSLKETENLHTAYEFSLL